MTTNDTKENCKKRIKPGMMRIKLQLKDFPAARRVSLHMNWAYLDMEALMGIGSKEAKTKMLARTGVRIEMTMEPPP